MTPSSDFLPHLLAPYVASVDDAMRRVVPPLSAARSFWGQLHYHLGWVNAAYEPTESPTGKRVRAAFCLMCCEALAGSSAPALPAAAAIELLHEFSLIHDDIEDGDRARRHRPTLWTVVGQPQAINAGDGLFALAQQAMLQSVGQGVPAAQVLHAQQRFNDAAVALCVGQHLDMSFEQRERVSPDEYLTMIRGKTAALLAFAGEAGALMAGAEASTARALYEVGEALGLAFQMQDDLLGLWGDPSRTGKPVGADIRAKKKSLPVTFALSHPESHALRTLYSRPIETEAQIAEASHLIEATGARGWVATQARAQAERARTTLQQVAEQAGGEWGTVFQLVALLTERDR